MRRPPIYGFYESFTVFFGNKLVLMANVPEVPDKVKLLQHEGKIPQIFVQPARVGTKVTHVDAIYLQIEVALFHAKTIQSTFPLFNLETT